MILVFVDTSALSKFYVSEVGTAWLQTLFDPKQAHQMLIAQITLIETLSVFARRQREKSISSYDALLLKKVFLSDAKKVYRVIRLTNDVMLHAQYLISAYPLRTLDAIQLASAEIAFQKLGIRPVFIGADQKLLDVAVLEGFDVENPNNYP